MTSFAVTPGWAGSQKRTVVAGFYKPSRTRYGNAKHPSAMHFTNNCQHCQFVVKRLSYWRTSRIWTWSKACSGNKELVLLLQLQPFNGLFSRTTCVSRYQKGKTNLYFTGARDSEWQWHQLGHMQACTSLQTTTPTPHHSFFTGRAKRENKELVHNYKKVPASIGLVKKYHSIHADGGMVQQRTRDRKSAQPIRDEK